MSGESVSVADVVTELGLWAPSLEDLRPHVDLALDSCPDAVADYRAGRHQALGRLVGFVMASTNGRAIGKDVARLLREALEGEGEHE